MVWIAERGGSRTQPDPFLTSGGSGSRPAGTVVHFDGRRSLMIFNHRVHACTTCSFGSFCLNDGCLAAKSNVEGQSKRVSFSSTEPAPASPMSDNDGPNDGDVDDDGDEEDGESGG